MDRRSTNARVLSVNLAQIRSNPGTKGGGTGIDKRRAAGPVLVRAPGDRAGGLGSGLVGDTVGDRANHGGDDQAVYAYAREDLDYWQSVLGRELSAGVFGENLTTMGLDVNEACVGERWRIGDQVELAVTCPRIPCSTFRGWIGEGGWLKMFTAAARPGAYLRVDSAGYLHNDSSITVVHRPPHHVTVAMVFRALTREPELLPSLLAAGDDLPIEARQMAAAGRTFSPG